jgi:6-pyruvoyltetrahydropterin/6-carboxytetrahydropterin synthase
MRHVARISKEVEFDAGHRVPSHGSKCRNPHGHRYRVRVTCEGPIVDDPGAPDDGMLVDFGDLKVLMNERIHDELDHGFICHHADPLLDVLHAAGLDDPNAPLGWHVIEFPYIPTAENLARWCWHELVDPIAHRFRDGLRLVEVAVWETPTSVAYYEGPLTARFVARDATS